MNCHSSILLEMYINSNNDTMNVPIEDKIPNVTTSPKLAAIGVAILSGPRNKLAKEAVETLDTIKIRIFWKLNVLSPKNSVMLAINDASSPTTIDCI
ncbi:hypothetical protein BpHYR1_048893 [Brachionus plicatilis]|uniref:Uncharacterized protein n=1 Tax=Brachionus plicatilis TaxID=10195 RepID=A0A3M7SRI4_BRAPC|nr:hypothetical protein BpHYR1_048893 [Brachionus plicatilis]